MENVMSSPPVMTSRSARSRLNRDRLIQALLLAGGCLALVVFLILPLFSLLSRSIVDNNGDYVGLANFATYLTTPSLTHSFFNSLLVAVSATVIVIPFAFGFAWVLTRTRILGRGVLKALALIPVLAPSLLPAISLVYLFGNQGILKEWLFGASIYGPIGIIVGSVFWTFPHALMILMTGLEKADARLYESARAMGASPVRQFFTITLPGAKYALFSAFFVVFTLVFTDFGVAKVIGGQFSVLPTDIYKQVIGQQNFSMGAVVGLLMLMPVLLAFAGDQYVQRKQYAQLGSRSVPLKPANSQIGNVMAVVFCVPVITMIIGITAMAVYASLVSFWPYNLTLSLNNFQAIEYEGGWEAYRNSLKLAGLTALIGTLFVFINAYLTEKASQVKALGKVYQFMAMIPLAVPGLVLGLGYIFFFNHPSNPMNGLYGSMTILVLCTVAHLLTVCHLTACTALKQIDNEFEHVSASLKVPFYTTFCRVVLPVSLPAVMDIAIYLFVNAMTTVSAVIFLYGPSTMLASVAIVRMDGSGNIAPAAALGVVIMLTSAGVKLLQLLLTRFVFEKNTTLARGLIHFEVHWQSAY